MKISIYPSITAEENEVTTRRGVRVHFDIEMQESDGSDEFVGQEVSFEVHGRRHTWDAKAAAIALAGIFHPSIANELRKAIGNNESASMGFSEKVLDEHENRVKAAREE